MGDRHLTIELGSGIDPETSSLVYAVGKMLMAARPRGFRETTPAYASLLVRYSPLETDFEAMARICLAAAAAAEGCSTDLPSGGRADQEAEGDTATVLPVAYGGEHGPDLEDVSKYVGLDPDEVVRRHSAALYRVYLIGFAPGFAYLGGVDPALETPRRAEPRSQVPAGSVGLAGRQTGVYPAALPGGWQIIGRTPARMWDPARKPPSLLAPGQLVRFFDAGRGAEGWNRAAAMLGKGCEPAGEVPAGGPSVNADPARDVAVVLRAGPLDTIQDGGRWGYSGVGLPESGALDWPALREANLAVGNDAGAAAIETTYAGLALQWTRPTHVAVSRGTLAVLEGFAVAPGVACEVRPGDVLSVGNGSRPRGYLAVAGGVAGPVVLGSRSTYLPSRLGGIDGRALRSGDIIRVGKVRPGAVRTGKVRSSGGRAGVVPAGGEPAGATGAARMTTARVVRGPQAGQFGEQTLEAFTGQDWRVLPSSDRRACLLRGEGLPSPSAAGVSDGVPAGSVQVLPSGQPVILLADHQSTGGYPKIAVVIGPDLPLLARAWPGSLVRFRTVSTEEARSAWLDMEPGVASSWPGNEVSEIPSGPGGQGRLFRLTSGGRSHLVSVRPSPPRAG